MSDDLVDIRADLVAEQQELDDFVARLSDEQWSTPTPAAGWDVRDQVGHLTYFDGTAALAITDPVEFAAGVDALLEGARASGFDEYTLGEVRALRPIFVLEMWRLNRNRLDRAGETLDNDTRVPWYGPSMGAKSFLTARLMEVWAHGQDILDAVGATRPATRRLRHIARLGFNTRSWSYTVRGESAPDSEARVTLSGTGGETWSFGPVDADDTVTGAIDDFCLVVTQRRHLDDTALATTGRGREWMLIAQAFAGGPTTGPAAGSNYGAG